MSTVADAARRTLRAGTVRVWHRGPWSPDGVDMSTTQIGVADLTRKRTALRSEGLGAGWDAFQAALVASNARVVAQAEAAEFDGAHRTFRVGEVGINMNMHGQSVVMQEGDRSPAAARSVGDPLWIVERLATEDVEGEGDAFRFTTDVRHDGVWAADALGRLTEVTWTRTERGRPRRLSSRRPHHRVWTTLRLDDYGLAVDVVIPDAFPTPPLTPRAIWEGWQALRPRRRGAGRS